VLPLEYIVPTLRTSLGSKILVEDSKNERVKKLLALEEKITCSLWHLEAMKNRLKAWANRNHKYNVFRKGDAVLLFNTKMGSHPSKLKMRWIGPYIIQEEIWLGTFSLNDLHGKMMEKHVNGFRHKPYHGTVNFGNNSEVQVGVITVESHYNCPF